MTALHPSRVNYVSNRVHGMCLLSDDAIPPSMMFLFGPISSRSSSTESLMANFADGSMGSVNFNILVDQSTKYLLHPQFDVASGMLYFLDIYTDRIEEFSVKQYAFFLKEFVLKGVPFVMEFSGGDVKDTSIVEFTKAPNRSPSSLKSTAVGSLISMLMDCYERSDIAAASKLLDEMETSGVITDAYFPCKYTFKAFKRFLVLYRRALKL